ncbi:MAG TPA: zinc/iron-chelating domain-containing protein [Desulfobacteraceae bacterium]|nr:zinc/iron-chelating domain-containing protein [Desulfobacteraceae bacterium]
MKKNVDMWARGDGIFCKRQKKAIMNKKKARTTFKPIIDNKFRFRCHREIACFTRCCADLSLVLTPYDILRIKNRLAMSSDDFLNRYVDADTDRHPVFPMVKLKMNHDEKKKCPFVSSDGCTIYDDRPGACRIYPLGRAATKPDAQRDTREMFFIVDEEHCLGFREDKEWTVEEWLKNEGVNQYNSMNDQWLEIITSHKSLGQEENLNKKIQMFFMASYNLDKFREFLFKSNFFSLFEIESGMKDSLASDDVELMKFSFKWLRFSLFGEKTIHIKS